VVSTNIAFWGREFIVVAIERLSAIFPEHDTGDLRG
jgi:hypothetical protein